jgi:hypothetical protein
MALHTDPDNFTKTRKLLNYFYSCLHYKLVKPISEGIEQQLENGLEAECGTSILGFGIF